MAKNKKGYKKLDWKGHDLFQCNYCPYNTMHENEIGQHLAARHLAELAELQKAVIDEIKEDKKTDKS